MIALALLAALHATPTPLVNSEPYMHAQRLVDIGNGRRMNIYCVGSGSPTVIFDSGLETGSGTLPWSRVQPAIASVTRACSYDRAGDGFSDPGPLPRTADAIVEDLHALLQSAGIAPPYVLVGHSIAGIYEPLFADRYPGEVVGMVLVDPSVPGQEALLTSELPKYAAFEDQQRAQLHRCADDPAQKACRPAMAAAAWRDVASELDNFGEDGAELDTASHGYGSMPIIVLTATEDMKSMQHEMGASNAQVEAVTDGWTTLHDQLAAQSSRGVNCVIAGSGHYIQTDKPNVVIEAIRQVLSLIPTDEKPSCAAWASPTSRPKRAPQRSRS